MPPTGYGPPPGYPGGPPGYAGGPPGYGAPPPGPVHPLDVGRAFKLGWSIFRFRWRTLLGAVLAVMVPAYVVQLLLTVYLGDAIQRWSDAMSEVIASNPPGQPIALADLPPLPLEAIGLSFLAGILVSVASVVAGAALVHVIGWTYGGGRASLGLALGQSVRRLPSLLGSSLLMALVIFAIVFAGGALIALLVLATGFQPGLAGLLVVVLAVATFAAVMFVGVRWQFVVMAIMLEGRGAVAAMGRSWRLATGSSWRVLGYLLLLLLVSFLVGLVVGVLSLIVFGAGVDLRTGQALPFSAARVAGQSALTVAIGLVIAPFYSAVMTLLYYDLRWRAREELTPPPA